MRKDNPIPEDLAVFRDRLRQLFRGQRAACACDGPPGIGKSYLLQQVAADEGKAYKLVGATTAGLVSSLHQYKDIPVLAFDDCDKVLRSEAMANVLKAACAPEVKRQITYTTKEAFRNEQRKRAGKSYDPSIAPSHFGLRCGICMITNLDMSKAEVVAKDMREHVRALADRGLEFIHINREPHNVYDYIMHHAPDMLRQHKLEPSDEAVNEVLDWYEKNAARYPDFSFRRLNSIMTDRMTLGNRWRIAQQRSFTDDEG